MIWGKEKIKTILPHREPFLFIDKVTKIEKGKHITAEKFIDPGSDFLKGHFPDQPVMPGVLTIEAMAQAGIILFYTTKPKVARSHPYYYFAKVQAEFMSPIFPNDTLILDAYNIKILDYAGIIKTVATIKGKIVAEATCSFAVKKKK